MTKQSGLAAQIYVDDSGGSARDISNDITDFTISTPRGEQDITGIDKSGFERLLLLVDGKVTLKGVFNAASNKSHDVFKTVPSTSVTRTVTINFPPVTTGSPTLALELNFTDYQITRGANGTLIWSAPGELANGAAPTWGTQS